ncbi:MAG: hypothetical protein RQ750_02025 [Roseovarius sp.]|nr:hypothetical protein [Roseovarius sp.]
MMFVVLGVWIGPVAHMHGMGGGLGLCDLRRKLVLTLDGGGGGDAQGKQHDKKRRERAQGPYSLDYSADFHY